MNYTNQICVALSRLNNSLQFVMSASRNINIGKFQKRRKDENKTGRHPNVNCFDVGNFW